MTTQVVSPLVISDTIIHQDEHGRFCLNDLHKASGSEKRHQPSNWLATQQAIELVDLVSIPGIPGIQSKQGLGTFAVKELVYAYAMWISPKFHLAVIRAYDALVMQAKLPDAPEAEEQPGVSSATAETMMSAANLIQRLIKYELNDKTQRKLARVCINAGLKVLGEPELTEQPQSDLLQTFWRNFFYANNHAKREGQIVETDTNLLNYSRSDDLICINFTVLNAHFADLGFSPVSSKDIKTATLREPEPAYPFVTCKKVWAKALGRPVNCFIFKA